MQLQQATDALHDVADPLAHPEPDVRLLLKLGSNEPLTEEEGTTWEAYKAELAATEGRRALLGIVELGEVILGEDTRPRMLVDDLIVEGEFHIWFGPRESGKTLLALVQVWHLMLEGKTVVWVDKEMGRRSLANRFEVIGTLTGHSKAEVAAIVSEYLVYCEYPSLDTTASSVAAWVMMLDARKPVALFEDALTEALADAGLNENRGTDIERWISAYVTPARLRGISTVIIDHVGHSEGDRPIAGQHKGAAAKLMLKFEAVTKPKREKVGELKVTCTKNSVDAPVPEVQRYKIGGLEGRFVYEPAGPPNVTDLLDAEGENRTATRVRIQKRILEVLQARPGQTKTMLRDQVSGGSAAKDDALAELVESGDVRVEDGSRANSLLYFIADSDTLPDSLPLVPRGSQEESGAWAKESQQES
jgi:hypothetical protein